MHAYYLTRVQVLFVRAKPLGIHGMNITLVTFHLLLVTALKHRGTEPQPWEILQKPTAMLKLP